MAKRIDQLDKNFKLQAARKDDHLRWLDSSDHRLTMRGLAWYRENKRRFNRLPLRARKTVRPDVWTLARCPSSARLCFKSDTTHLSVKVTNAESTHMPHMPESGQSGLALYVGEPHRMRPWRMAIPPVGKAQYDSMLLEKLPKAMREYTLYLPLYNYPEKLELGFSKGARFEPPSSSDFARPVVFYGTSITQGGCASTAGSDFVSTIGRLLNLDVINLGFSGNGRGEPEVARLIGEMEASLFVLDYAGNVSPEGLTETLPEFYRILRRKHPGTRIFSTIYCLRSGIQASAEMSDMDAQHFAADVLTLGEEILNRDFENVEPVEIEACEDCDFLPRCRHFWRWQARRESIAD